MVCPQMSYDLKEWGQVGKFAAALLVIDTRNRVVRHLIKDKSYLDYKPVHLWLVWTKV